MKEKFLKQILASSLLLTTFTASLKAADEPITICLAMAMTMTDELAGAAVEAQASILEIKSLSSTPTPVDIIEHSAKDDLEGAGFMRDANKMADSFLAFLKQKDLTFVGLKSETFETENYDVYKLLVVVTAVKSNVLAEGKKPKGSDYVDVSLGYNTSLAYDTCYGEGYVPGPTGVVVEKNQNGNLSPTYTILK